jgi:8-oxo-dGTP pyrophosphatase MutT (NUDIX family)
VTELELLPFEEYVRSLNKKRMAAGVLVYDADDRIMLVELSYVTHWDIPGGTVDAGESPWTTATREMREELGMEQPLGRLLVIDYIPNNRQWPEGLAFIFDGGTVTDRAVRELTVTDPEIVSVGLYSMGVAASKVTPALFRRLTAALSALRTGKLALAEDGRDIAP